MSVHFIDWYYLSKLTDGFKHMLDLTRLRGLLQLFAMPILLELGILLQHPSIFKNMRVC